MPEKDGPQTAMEIRELCNAKGVAVPYICCATSYQEASFKRNAFEAGMNDFIAKPITVDVVKRLLKDVLGIQI